MEYQYGHFNANGDEFIVTRPDTPRAFDNFLWNEAAFSNTQQTGVGYFDYQVNGQEAVQLLTGVGRICDFDVFGREHLMSRLIYIRDNDTGEFWTVNWEPVKRDYQSFECVHGLGYTIIRSQVNDIAATFRLFIPPGRDPVELWSVQLTNVSDRQRHLSVFVYNQFQFKFKWGFDSYGDMIYRTVSFNKELNAVIATKHPSRRPHDHLTGFVAADRPIVAFDGSRDAFVGVYSTLGQPEAVTRGRCSNTPGSAEATIAALQFDLHLPANSAQTIELILGASDGEAGAQQLKEKYLGHQAQYFSQLKEDTARQLAVHTVRTPDEHLNRMLNYWVKRATLYGAAWCRWGYNGYRDIVQHGLGVSALDPLRTKAILLEALRYQYNSGLALRGWNPIDEKPYSDSALWLVFTLIAYLKETGDTALLEQEVPFYDGGSATVYQHIETALDFLENNKGAHDLLLIKFGDWNDSLTGVGKEGRGESVWLSLAYAEAMQQMTGLAAHLGDATRQAQCTQRRENILRAINQNAWDGNWYTRCFDDSGRPIGAHDNKYARIFMEPQCWALITGAADETRTQTLLAACDELLGTPVGYQLLAPPFREIDDNIGRISSMEPGIAENGTVYAHLNIWMILGLLRSGQAEQAYALFQKITPGYVSGTEDLKQKCPPYMYANCYFGPDHRNNAYQMEFTWITGSVAWFNTVLLQEMLGVKPDYAGLRLEPCLPATWETVEVERTFRNAQYHIRLQNPHHLSKGHLQITVDGQPCDGPTLPDFQDGQMHQIEVQLTPLLMTQ